MRIRTTVEFSGVPKDTTGECIREKDTPYSKKKIWKVTWDLPRSKPLSDWFDQSEFDEYLEVLK